MIEEWRVLHVGAPCAACGGRLEIAQKGGHLWAGFRQSSVDCLVCRELYEDVAEELPAFLASRGLLHEADRVLVTRP